MTINTFVKIGVYNTTMIPYIPSHLTKQFINNNVPQLLERTFYREYLSDVKREVEKENSKILMNSNFFS
jgi:hypothetical protein